MQIQFKINEIRLLNAEYSMKKEFEPSEVEENNENEGRPIPLEISCGSKFNDKSLNLIVAVKVSCKDPELPFDFSVEYGGSFDFDSKPKAEELERIGNINCPSIIFPYIRELVSEIVRRGGYEPLLIPPINFVALYKENKAHGKIHIEKISTDSNE